MIRTIDDSVPPKLDNADRNLLAPPRAWRSQAAAGYSVTYLGRSTW